MSRHGGKNVVQAGLFASIVPYMLKTSDNPNGVGRDVIDGIIEGLEHDRTQFFAEFFKNFFGGGSILGACEPGTAGVGANRISPVRPQA